MLNLIKELINEHGSSTILKERLMLINDQYTALERRYRDLEAEHATLKSQLREAELQNQPSAHVKGKPVFCSHCGSSHLKRTGSKPDKVFGDLGINRILFSCLDCSKESDFLDD